MRIIRTFFINLKALGVFGLILLLTALIIIAVALSFSALANSFETTYWLTVKLNSLEDEITFNLLEMQINATYYELSDGDDFYKTFYEEAYAVTDDELTFLVSEVPISNLDEEDLLLAMSATLVESSQAFSTLDTAIVAQEEPGIDRGHREFNDQIKEMQEQLVDLIFLVKTTRTTALQQLEAQTQRTILVGILGLILLPFLALWAFSVTGQITQPILTLTNAVVAIEGDQFRPDLLSSVINRNDGLGKLALGLEDLAQTLTERQDTLEGEMQALREQLRKSRRRKRLPTSSGKQ